MRVLIDECVPKRLGRSIPQHEVLHVTAMGWSGKKNGELLQLIKEHNIDALITVDQNLYYQQNLTGSNLFVLVLVAKSNQLADLVPLVDSVVTALNAPKPGTVLEIDH